MLSAKIFGKKKGRVGPGLSLFDDGFFKLELRTASINGKAWSSGGADDEFDFVRTTLPCNRVAAQLTEIALKDFHRISHDEYLKMSTCEVQSPYSPEGLFRMRRFYARHKVK
jgi:hypothetical protein